MAEGIQQILETVNKMVVRYTPKDKFVTLFYGVFDQSKNQFEYATAGHNYPIWLRNTSQKPRNTAKEYIMVKTQGHSKCFYKKSIELSASKKDQRSWA